MTYTTSNGVKIFITGGSGMLGRVLVKHFRDVIAPSQEEFDLLKPSTHFQDAMSLFIAPP